MALGTVEPARNVPQRSHQKLLGNGAAEAVGFSDEVADEFVQPALENALHPGVLQPRADAARLALRGALAALGARNPVEIADDGLVTGGERARHLLLEDQQV